MLCFKVLGKYMDMIKRMTLLSQCTTTHHAHYAWCSRSEVQETTHFTQNNRVCT